MTGCVVALPPPPLLVETVVPVEPPVDPVVFGLPVVVVTGLVVVVTGLVVVVVGAVLPQSVS